MFKTLKFYTQKKNILLQQFKELLELTNVELDTTIRKTIIKYRTEVKEHHEDMRMLGFIDYNEKVRNSIINSFDLIIKTLKPGNINYSNEILKMVEDYFEIYKVRLNAKVENKNTKEPFTDAILEVLDYSDAVVKARIKLLIENHNYNRLNWLSLKRDEMIFTVFGLFAGAALSNLDKLKNFSVLILDYLSKIFIS